MSDISNSDAACLLGFFLILGSIVGFFLGYLKGYQEAKHEHK